MHGAETKTSLAAQPLRIKVATFDIPIGSERGGRITHRSGNAAEARCDREVQGDGPSLDAIGASRHQRDGGQQGLMVCYRPREILRTSDVRAWLEKARLFQLWV